MDESPVSLNNVEDAAAEGGKVWSPPPAPTPTPTSTPALAPAIKPSRATSFFGKISGVMLENPTLFWGLTAAICIGWIATCLLFGVTVSPDEELSDAWEQEYGYQEVSVNNSFTRADVVTDAGETITVDALTYKEARILFESQEQLYEKIDRVENGTYPEELYQP